MPTERGDTSRRNWPLHEALELYSSLEEKFDAEDIEGALTDVAEELKKLPGFHDALWDLFKEVKNKKDEEAYELALESKDRRDDFYTRLSCFCRVLKMALSSIKWVNATSEELASRYKQDAAFFQNLRASVRIRYAEEIDYRDYEKQIQKMLNTYVQADEIIQVVEPVNIFEREAFEKEVEKMQTDRAKADTIANRTKKTITEKMEEDPFFYRKLSSLLQQAIDDYKAQRISEAEYLHKVKEVMEQARGGHTQEAPDLLKNRDFSRALFGAIKGHLANPVLQDSMVREDGVGGPAQPASPAQLEQVMVEAACSMEDIVRSHAVVRWRENIDAQNRMRNDLDDFLYGLQREKGMHLTFGQMDAIIESVIRIAIHRTDDV